MMRSSIFKIGLRLESIKEEIDSYTTIARKKLDILLVELLDAQRFFEKHPDITPETYQREVISLIGRLHNLDIDTQVLDVETEAKNLSKRKTQNIAHKVDELHKKIDALVCNHALSLQNRKMILSANKYLKSIEEYLHAPSFPKMESLKEKNVVPIENVSPLKEIENRIEASEMFYLIATHIYQGKRREALSVFKAIPQSYHHIIEEILPKLHIYFSESNKIDPKFTKLIMDIIRSLLFHAEKLNEALTSETPHNDATIHQIFQDLAYLEA